MPSSASAGGSPMFSASLISRRRPAIRNPGFAPRVPISVGAIPARIIDCASCACVSGACGSSASTNRSPPFSPWPAASAQIRSSRGPGTPPGGTALTAPRVHCAASGARSGTACVLTRGRPSSDCVISACRPHSVISAATARARQAASTTIDTRARPPDVTTWPGPASNPLRSVTAGGTDSAEKKDSWPTSGH